MFEDLILLGMTPHKSNTLKLPRVPKKYFSDFVRGYFDGDGNVYANAYQRKGRKRKSMTLLTGFTCGSGDFLLVLHQKLQEAVGLRGGSVFRRGTYFRLHYSVQDSCKLYTFMYNEAGHLFLARKKKIFEKYFREQSIVRA